MPTGDFEDEAAFRERMGASPYMGISPYVAASDAPFVMPAVTPKKTSSNPYMPLLENVATDTGVDADYLARIMKIESGGDPRNRTGSYRGLFQLSPSEFTKYGGTGDIYDPEQNARAAARKTAAEAQAFQAKFGRAPTSTDLYMTHQQGEGGYAQHIAAPDAPAWQNMYATAEGRQKGPAWAKQAIWGNIPDSLKPQFGSVNNVKSQDLIDIYARKLGYGADAQLPLSFAGPVGLPQSDEPPAPGSAAAMGSIIDTPLPGGDTIPANARLTAGQTPPGAPAGPPTGNLPFGIPGTIGSNPIQQALGDNFSTLLAFAGGARQGGIGQGLTQAAKASLVSDQQRELALHRQQDMAWRRLEAMRAQSNTDRAFGLQAQQVEEGKLPTGYRRTKDGGLEAVPEGPADLKRIAAEAAAKRGPGLTDATTDIIARQLIAGDLSGLTNIGRGAQGDQKLSEIRNRAADILTNEQGMSAGDAATHLGRQMQAFKASGIGQGQEARTTATREANLKIILKATDAAIPAALEASSAVARTGWVPLNKIIQRGQVIASSPELKEFGMANLQLAEHWARAMNPTGVMRESDRDLALGFLSTADSQPTYVRAVQQLKKQIDREYEAVRSGKPGEGPVLPSGASSTSGAAAPATARGAPPPPPGFKVQ